MKRLLFLLLLLPLLGDAYTRQDTLRGSNGRGRDWWDVVSYGLTIELDTATKSIRGTNNILSKIVGKTHDSLQLDLQEGIVIDSVCSMHQQGNQLPTVTRLDIERDGNVYWVIRPGLRKKKNDYDTLSIAFHGKPRTAVNPPWDGGFIWTKDSVSNPWIAVACQGLGASSWWPCKDYQGDEPDSGMAVIFTYERMVNQDRSTSLSLVGNGGTYGLDNSRGHWPNTLGGRITNTSHTWCQVRNPINTYNISFYIGDYAHWHDTLHGEQGVLDLDFYPLRYNEAKARRQWAQAKEMLRCFEWWMGPYPFYEDGYKLVEAPYLGMEHQSAIAYGNHYTNGYYRPTGPIDRSGTGVGMAFDFIIIHESGHEWFGNSITARDIADNWLHEGFTTYTETLFAEWIKGKDSAFAYAQGEWKNIKNDRPVIGDYGVNDEGSSDKYDKGAAVVHMIRMMINDDKRFRELLRGLNRDFYHKIVTSREVEDYISRFMGRDLGVFFDVYLRSTKKPVLEWRLINEELQTQWAGVPKSFSAPFILQFTAKEKSTIISDHPAATHIVVKGKMPEWPFIKSCGWYDVVERK